MDNEDNILYDEAMESECEKAVDALKKKLDAINISIETGNKASSVNCSLKNIDGAISNLSEALNGLKFLSGKVEYAKAKMAKIVGVEVSDMYFDETRSLTLTNEGWDEIDFDNLSREDIEKFGLDQLMKNVENVNAWTENEKKEVFTQLFWTTMINYTNVAYETYETGTEYVSEYFDAYNYAFKDGENGYPTLEAKKDEYYNWNTKIILQTMTENYEGVLVNQNVDHIMELLKTSPGKGLPEEFSFIPDFMWEATSAGDSLDGSVSAETCFKRAMLIMNFSDEPDKKIDVYINGFEWEASDWKAVNYYEPEFHSKTYNALNYSIEPIKNHFINMGNLLGATKEIISESVDEQGNLKSTIELCEVFNTGYSKMAKCIKTDESGLMEIINTVPSEVGKDKKEDEEEAWLGALKEMFPEEYGDITLKDIRDNEIAYTSYLNIFGSSRVLLSIREQKGDEGVKEFLGNYYKKLGLSDDDLEEVDYKYIFENLNMFEKRENSFFKNMEKSFYEANGALNQINLLQKNYLDYQVRGIKLIPKDISEMSDAEKASALGINVEDLKNFDNSQIVGAIYLMRMNPELGNKYVESFKEVIMDKKAQMEARKFMDPLLSEAWGIFKFFHVTGTGFAHGIHNFGADLCNFFVYDGKVSQMELTQYYINQYLSNDWGVYKHYDDAGKYLSDVSADYDKNNEIYNSLSSAQRNAFDARIKALPDGETIKLYELLYEIGNIDEEQYRNLKTFANTPEEDLEFYLKLGKYSSTYGSSSSSSFAITSGWYNLMNSAGYMAIPMTLNILSSAVGMPALGVAGLSLMGAASGGQAQERMAQSGETNELKIRSYGLLNMAITMAVERMGGLMAKKGNGLEELTKEVKKNLMQICKEEVREELLELAVGNVVDLLYGQELPQSMGEALGEFALTGLQAIPLTLLYGGVGRAVNFNVKHTFETPLGTYEMSLGELAKFSNGATINQNELCNFLRNNNRVSTNSVTEIETKLNSQLEGDTVKSIKIVNGNIEVETNSGTKITYNLLGEKVSESKAKTKEILQQEAEEAQKLAEKSQLEVQKAIDEEAAAQAKAMDAMKEADAAKVNAEQKAIAAEVSEEEAKDAADVVDIADGLKKLADKETIDAIATSEEAEAKANSAVENAEAAAALEKEAADKLVNATTAKESATEKANQAMLNYGLKENEASDAASVAQIKASEAEAAAQEAEKAKSKYEDAEKEYGETLDKSDDIRVKISDLGEIEGNATQAEFDAAKSDLAAEYAKLGKTGDRMAGAYNEASEAKQNAEVKKAAAQEAVALNEAKSSEVQEALEVLEIAQTEANMATESEANAAVDADAASKAKAEADAKKAAAIQAAAQAQIEADAKKAAQAQANAELDAAVEAQETAQAKAEADAKAADDAKAEADAKEKAAAQANAELNAAAGNVTKAKYNAAAKADAAAKAEAALKEKIDGDLATGAKIDTDIDSTGTETDAKKLAEASERLKTAEEELKTAKTPVEIEEAQAKYDAAKAEYDEASKLKAEADAAKAKVDTGTDSTKADEGKTPSKTKKDIRSDAKKQIDELKKDIDGKTKTAIDEINKTLDDLETQKKTAQERLKTAKTKTEKAKIKTEIAVIDAKMAHLNVEIDEVNNKGKTDFKDGKHEINEKTKKDLKEVGMTSDEKLKKDIEAKRSKAIEEAKGKIKESKDSVTEIKKNLKEKKAELKKAKKDAKKAKKADKAAKKAGVKDLKADIKKLKADLEEAKDNAKTVKTEQNEEIDKIKKETSEEIKNIKDGKTDTTETDSTETDSKPETTGDTKTKTKTDRKAKISILIPGAIAGAIAGLILIPKLPSYVKPIDNPSKDEFYLNLKGDKEITLSLNNVYEEPGYEAYDSKDGDITDKVIVSGNDKLDASKEGQYIITYTVTNSQNKTITKERKVIYVKKAPYDPMINLITDPTDPTKDPTGPKTDPTDPTKDPTGPKTDPTNPLTDTQIIEITLDDFNNQIEKGKVYDGIKINTTSLTNQYINKFMLQKRTVYALSLTSMVTSNSYYSDINACNSNYLNTEASALIITNGTIERVYDSANSCFNNYGVFYFTTNKLNYAKVTNEAFNKIIIDSKTRNTFVYKEVLVDNGMALNPSETLTKNNAICQTGPKTLKIFNFDNEVSYNDISKLMIDNGCQTGVLLTDGDTTLYKSQYSSTLNIERGTDNLTDSIIFFYQ